MEVPHSGVSEGLDLAFALQLLVLLYQQDGEIQVPKATNCHNLASPCGRKNNSPGHLGTYTHWAVLFPPVPTPYFADWMNKGFKKWKEKKRWKYLICMEGLVAGLGRTTVVNTGHTEPVVQNLQLRDNKREREGKEEKTKNGKKKENSSKNEPRRKGWREKKQNKRKSHKYNWWQQCFTTAGSCGQVPSSLLSEKSLSSKQHQSNSSHSVCKLLKQKTFLRSLECFVEFG